MSIPISDIINVQIAVSPNSVATDGYGPLLFLTQQFKPVAGELPVRSYTSLKEVQTDFPTGDIPKAATAYYSQKPTPKTFLVGALAHPTVTPATPGTLTAATAATLSDLKLITAGTMTVSLNGSNVTIDQVALDGAADLPAVVTEINTAFSSKNIGIVCSQTSGKFKLETVSTGVNATVNTATGDLATALKLDAASNPLAFTGANELSIAMDLAAIANTNFQFFFVAVELAQRDTTNQKAVATWCEASNRVFGWGSSNPDILKSGTSNSFKEAKDANLRQSLCVYDASENMDEYPEISILGRAATVNFNVANSVLILAFKQGPTITTADLSSGQLTALESYNGNAFISVGGNTMFYNGKMADGTWFDTVQGVAWLTDKIRVNVFNLFYQSTTKIPWTDTGVAMVNQQVTLALELAVTNGLIAAGYDNEGTFYPDGYKVMSTDLSLMQSQKGTRIWEGTSFIAIGSGALQGATITGNFVQ